MDKDYLLTYQSAKSHEFQYEWFETEEELREFVIVNKIEVIDAIKIIVEKEIEL